MAYKLFDKKRGLEAGGSANEELPKSYRKK